MRTYAGRLFIVFAVTSSPVTFLMFYLSLDLRSLAKQECLMYNFFPAKIQQTGRSNLTFRSFRSFRSIRSFLFVRFIATKRSLNHDLFTIKNIHTPGGRLRWKLATVERVPSISFVGFVIWRSSAAPPSLIFRSTFGRLQSKNVYRLADPTEQNGTSVLVKQPLSRRREMLNQDK